LRGIDMDAHPELAVAAEEEKSSGAAGGTKVRTLPNSAAAMKHLDDMRVFHQTCELHLQAGAVDDFLAIATPVLVNIINAAMLVIDDDVEPMPHRMEEPRVGAGADATSRGLPIFPTLPVDKANSFTAQRSMLSSEFLRPACAAIKHLYARDRLPESLWLIHHLDRMLQRYIHTPQPPSSAIAQPGSTAHSTGAISSSMSFSEQVRLIMLGLKYVSAGIFLRCGDAERAYHAIRAPLQHLPYSFPLAHTMNVILNAQSYPGKAIKTLERLLVKHPDSLPLKMLLGHGCLVHQNYECALQHYLQIYAQQPNHALVLLLIGITKLQISLKKLNLSRQHDLIQPFATQEAYYNLARAFQYVGLMYQAIPHYHQVLTLSAQVRPHAQSDVSKRPIDSYQPDSTAASSTALTSLHADAAHNLACIYAQTGSPDLARRLYAQYCRV
jgi:tetratricopeptide (TPR) repeat protein